MHDRTVISTTAAPAAIGPYSQAIRAGQYVFLSGQIALDPGTGQLVGDDAAAQTRQVMANLAAVLDAAGVSLEHVVRCTIFLTDMADFAAMNAVWDAWIDPANPPARACVQTTALARPDLTVEIMATAAR